LAESTYDGQVSGCRVEVRVLEELLRIKMPVVHAHLHACGVPLIAVVTQWFLSLFTQSCPMEVCISSDVIILFVI
jgi:hypothetical protein